MRYLPIKLLCTVFLLSATLPAQEGVLDEKAAAAELAKKLANPVAALISVPIQFNADYGLGPAGDGVKYVTNIQPVIPFDLDEQWNIISRTILPVISQNDVIGTGSQSGIGDVSQSVFISPKAPTAGGVIWGAGPVFLLPTASDDLLGGKKWCIGPTALALVQEKGWTRGILMNHLWSVAGDSDRSAINATYLQPFVAYGGLSPGLTVGGAFEATYDWKGEQWTIPFVANASQILKVKGQLISVGLGVKVYLDKPVNGPDWGLRFTLTLLFPK